MRGLRLVTLNTWKNEGQYAARVDAMAAQLAALDADIIALQECFFCPDTGEDTAARLAEAAGLHLIRARARRKQRAHRGALVESWSDLALLSRMPPRDPIIVALPEDPRDGDRPAIVADFDLGENQRLRVAATHLTHLRDAEGRRARAAQAQALLDLARGGWTHPFVIMGDLNDLAESAALTSLFDDAGLDRASIPPPVSAADRLRLGAIDHVLLYDAGSAWRIAVRALCVTAPCADGAAPSDHPGVLLDLIAV
jgi:endonuclease/exonuclease/phosphatase family metal-dependent hydrolase